MSWLGPASSGAHPRTKGARFCTGGHRHRIPLTTKGLPMVRAAWQAIGGPFTGAEETQIRRTRAALFAKEATFRSHGRHGWAGRAHESGRQCALGVPQGMRDMGHTADGGHDSRSTGSVRSLCGRCCYGVECARHHAWTRRILQAMCLCSRDTCCTTRTGRSCRCAGAWERRRAGKWALGES